MMDYIVFIAMVLGVAFFMWAWITIGTRYINRMLAPEYFPTFKPCVIYNEELRLTEMILEDTSIVWCPWGPYKGHAVDCGYSTDGRLVGIKIWDDVRERKSPATPAAKDQGK